MKLLGIAITCLVFLGPALATEPSNPFSLLQAAADPVLANPCPGGGDVTSELVNNVHVPNLVDRLETRRCPGVSVQTYISKAASDPSGLSVRLEVTQPNQLLPKSVNVGQPVSQLLSRLGTPGSTKGGTLIYSDSQGPDTVEFKVANGKIRSILWCRPID
jgi:hypothetical protein